MVVNRTGVHISNIAINNMKLIEQIFGAIALIGICVGAAIVGLVLITIAKILDIERKLHD